MTDEQLLDGWFRDKTLGLETHAVRNEILARMNRDSVIEACAKVVDKFANSATDNSTQFILDICSDDIRALKSQQDAAIGDGS